MWFCASSRSSSECVMSPAPRLDPRAFEEIVAAHRDDVLGVCLSILRDHDLGADASQDTFLRLFIGEEVREPALTFHPECLEKVVWGSKVVGVQADLPASDPKLIQGS